MDIREKLVELLSEKCMETCKQRKGYACSVEECKCSKEKCCGFYADHLISNGVTVQECKVAEIDQFKLPIDDAILILKEEYKQMVDGYTTHLSYGGNGDPAEEVHIDALGMAIAALELQKQTFPHHQKENDNE